jgi:hypothetical protein
MSEAGPRQKSVRLKKMAASMVQVLECLSSEGKTLSSNLSTIPPPQKNTKQN